MRVSIFWIVFILVWVMYCNGLYRFSQKVLRVAMASPERQAPHAWER